MPFDGSGNYTPAAAPNFPAVGGTTIVASYYNNVINDIASALSNTLTRDGQGKPTANIDWNNKNLTNVNTLAAGTLSLTNALGVASGGTGALSFTTNYLLKGNGTSPLTVSQVFDNGTNVGIGTAAPVGKLDVVGSNSRVRVELTTTAVTWITTNPSASAYANAVYDSLAHVFKLSNATAMTLDSSGNLGIGTATPTAKLDVIGGIYSRPGDSAGAVADLSADAVSGANGISLAAGFASGGYGPIKLNTSATERFRIAASGALGLSGANYGTSGQVITSQGSGSAPVWGNVVTSVGGIGSVNGLTLTGTVTGSGNLTLGGSITSVATSATIDGITIGYRSIPRSTTSGTAVVADVGKCIAVSAGITIPNSTFAAGDAVSIYNDSGSAITITAGVTTLRLAGTATTGNRTLAARGLATIWFNSPTEAVISGAGVS